MRPATDTSTASRGTPGRSTVSFSAPSSQADVTTGVSRRSKAHGRTRRRKGLVKGVVVVTRLYMA